MAATKELMVYQNVKNPLEFARELGTELAKSRMFGCENESQGRVLAMACLAEGTSPIHIARTHHIIQGNLSMRADAMLAEFNALGGKHKIVERTSDRAEVELSIGDETYTESLAWNEAQLEPYPFEKDGTTPKKNWRTPRARRQMLWARVISEAVRTLRPGIVAGVYTPEEIDGFEVEHKPANGQPVDVEQLTKERATKSEANSDEPIDATFEVVETAADESTAEQREEIKQLLESLNASNDALEGILAKRGVKALRQLSKVQATELLAGLREKLAGKSKLPEQTREARTDGPVDDFTIDRIRELMVGEPEIVKQVKAHLVKHGVHVLANLTAADAELLQNCLESRQMETFFGRVLADASPF